MRVATRESERGRHETMNFTLRPISLANTVNLENGCSHNKWSDVSGAAALHGHLSNAGDVNSCVAEAPRILVTAFRRVH